LFSGEFGPGIAITWEIELPEDMESGIVYSVAPERFSAAWDASANALNETESWLAWEALWEANWRGEPLTAVVRRSGPNDYGTMVSSAYTGISRQMEGTGTPYLYFAPYVMKGYLNQLDTKMTIQNSGQECTAVWIDYIEQGTCNLVYTQHIQQLAPGEAVRVKVPTVPGVLECDWPGWLGSARISAEQPLGIIFDQTSFDIPCGSMDRGVLVTARVEPYDDELSSSKLYGPMIFREISGWDTTVNVHNLSPLSEAWVTVEFLDASGGTVLSLSDRVCANGSLTYYLPAVTDLGFNYVGAVTIESLEREGIAPQPISAIVSMSRPDDFRTPGMDAQEASYNAIPQSLVENVRTITLPFLAKGETTSAIGIRNNSNCNGLAAILDIYDDTDLLASVPISIDPEEVEYIDMNNMGVPMFTGSGILRVSVDEILYDGEEIPGAEVPMPSVVVVNAGTGLGDIMNAYEGMVAEVTIPTPTVTATPTPTATLTPTPTPTSTPTPTPTGPLPTPSRIYLPLILKNPL
jgi:hypothetical protein